MLLFRKKMILAKIESVYGTDPTPTGAANAILTKDLSIQTFQGNTVELNYDKPYLGNDKSLYTAPYTTVSFGVDVAGSGTAGTVPAYDPLLRACGFAAAANVTAETGTATAGGASTITLAVTASAVDDTYNDFLINITGGTGSGQTRRIRDYVGATKVATVSVDWTTPPDATSVYSIFAQVVYAPISDSFESVAIYYFLDGQRHRLAGARGTVEFTMNREQLPMLKFTFTGKRVAQDASANPTPDFDDFQEPLPVNDTNTTELMVHAYSACTESLSFNMANSVVYRAVVNCEAVHITDRKPTMQVAIEMPATGTKNYDAIIAAHTAGDVHVIHGLVSGNIVRLDAPLVQLTNPQIGDSDGLATLTMDGRPLASDAGNDEVFITVY